MEEFKVTIKGITPLMMHRFHGQKPAGAQGNVNPREEAKICLHAGEDGKVFIPSEALFGCIIGAGKFNKLKANKLTTMKESLIPAYLGIKEATGCYLVNGDGKTPITTEKGWEVDTRRVVNQTTQGAHMANRPRIDQWATTFTLQVYEPENFGELLARKILDDAGTKVGLLVMRPSRKGNFGKFIVQCMEKIS